MRYLMAGLVKYADFDSTKDPGSDEEEAGKGKKNGTPRGSTIRWVKVTTVSARPIIIQTLWLIPMRRIIINVVRESVNAPVWRAKVQP